MWCIKENNLKEECVFLHMNKWLRFVAFGFGSGLIKWAPGTWGTLFSLVLWWPLSSLPIWYYSAFLVLAILFGIWLCDRAALDMDCHDHPSIVWDEFCGYWVTMLFLPREWHWAIAGCVLFRIFDIWKPGLIRWLDRSVKGGFGIMMDDIAAGLCAGVLLWVFQHIV